MSIIQIDINAKIRYNYKNFVKFSINRVGSPITNDINSRVANIIVDPLTSDFIYA